MIAGKSLEQWQASHPLVARLMALDETAWFNPAVRPVAEALRDVGLARADVADASARLARDRKSVV